MKIAEIRNLSYSYRENCGQKKAVSNVSFDIDEGICDDKFERRFVCSCGVFSFFYPTDKKENELRY